MSKLNEVTGVSGLNQDCPKQPSGGMSNMVVKKVGGKYRIVEEATGKITQTKNGKPVDGGGHGSAAKAHTQA